MKLEFTLVLGMIMVMNDGKWKSRQIRLIKMPKLISKTSVVVFVLLTTSLQITCTTQEKSDNSELTYSLGDTLNYNKNDYDLMRVYFNSDSLFLLKLKEGIQEGDTNSIKLNRLLTTDYESRNKIGISDSEIDAIMLSYFASKRIIQKFDKVNNELKNINHDTFQGKADSIINSMEVLSNDLKNK